MSFLSWSMTGQARRIRHLGASQKRLPGTVPPAPTQAFFGVYALEILYRGRPPRHARVPNSDNERGAARRAARALCSPIRWLALRGDRLWAGLRGYGHQLRNG